MVAINWLLGFVLFYLASAGAVGEFLWRNWDAVCGRVVGEERRLAGEGVPAPVAVGVVVVMLALAPLVMVLSFLGALR